MGRCGKQRPLIGSEGLYTIRSPALGVNGPPHVLCVTNVTRIYTLQLVDPRKAAMNLVSG